ncbi:Ankyrin repeat-containing domain protein [Metarhizium robertsii ARSEF 23]|uniref:Ankyrin repeat-containing domain protein n=1 Tax=Metarhizium robertsii (strain ARSEF 23 / ATCC MYA-3075) TaxID=655844 RepID=E9EJ52_METRA|nr:Ankyrin repeat-containing domain protein [Metarhizium robertsii ARSEF 23]EFZ03329.2 Ankyrin repeat-containing domain protein [Metarhizium robertsii ARSEF 23]
MTPKAGLSYTPVEVLSYIFEDLTLTELDILEQACDHHHLRYIVADYFRRRVLRSSKNPLLELSQIHRAQDIEQLALQSAVPDVNVTDEVGRTPLHLAAEMGYICVVQALLDFPGISIDHRDGCGRSALVIASQNGHYKAASILLQHRAAVDLPTYRGETAFLWAARNGHCCLVKQLISNETNTLSTDAEGWRGVDWAIMQGQDRVVELLLSHHDYFQGSLVQQNKLLLLAAESGNDAALRMLLAAGGDVNCRDERNNTPLHWAVSCGHQSTVELLLDRAGEPNSKDKYGNTPLHWASTYPSIANILIKQNADVDAQNSTGKTSLMCSVLASQEETTLRLLTLGRANVDIQDENGWTALHGAAAKGNESILLHILDEGANIITRDIDGWTPLDVAVINGHATAMAILRDKMANNSVVATPRLVNNEHARCILEEMSQRKSTGSEGVSGLRSFVNSKHTARLQAMLDVGADIDELDPVGGATALTLASWFNDTDIAKLLLDNGATIDAKDSSGRTALHVAVEGGYCDLVGLLVDNGADIETKFCGWTPLLLAAKRLWDHEVGSWMVKYLSAKPVGANLHAKDYYGRGVLHWCAVYGEIPTLTDLVRLDSTLLNIKDYCGQTALHYAVGARRVDLVRVLLQQDVNTASRSCDGLTPAHVAAYTGQLDVLTLLVNACKSAREHCGGNRASSPSGHVTRPPGVELQLSARDTNGYTALSIALLTGSLQIAQFLRRLPGGDKGGFEYPRSITYPSIVAWCPPPLQLPTDDEVLDLNQAIEGAGPRKPLFGTTVREWLQNQHRLITSELAQQEAKYNSTEGVTAFFRPQVHTHTHTQFTA